MLLALLVHVMPMLLAMPAVAALVAAVPVASPRTVKIPSGSFRMGVGSTPLPFNLTTNGYHRCSSKAADAFGCGKLFGDYDERHNHRVSISQSFAIGTTEVTNADYERYDPAHREQRGRLGFSVQDYEAVVFVSWFNATGYANWLTERDPGVSWRLPTEAEWEYACRAGTTTYFNTGDEFPTSQCRFQDVTDFPRCKMYYAHNGTCAVEQQLDGFLRVAAHAPSAWGLHDCHGNVEEWVADWYDAGYYSRSPASDPQGPPTGTFKVTRGGSHSTEVYYLRSANRAAQLPTERTWLTGFRLVSTPKAAAGGDAKEAASTQQRQEQYSHQQRGSDVSGIDNRLEQQSEKPPSEAEAELTLPLVPAGTAPAGAVPGWNSNTSKPLFLGPARYVNIPNNSFGPLWTKHNHDPALAVVPGSGDVLAVWFTTYTEPGREAALATATLPAGSETLSWGAANSLYDPPDRCMCCPALFANESSGELLLFSQQSPQASYGNGIVLRHVSSDGSSWKVAPVVSMDFYSLRHQPVETVISLADGSLVLPADNGRSPAGTALHFSQDGGQHFTDPGGNIAGLHGAVAQLKNGSLFAIGRGHDGPCPQDRTRLCLAQSYSENRGVSWHYSTSELPAIHSGQRETLLRLREGPLLFTGYANDAVGRGKPCPELLVRTVSGKSRPVSGLYAALSYDEGGSWIKHKLISDNSVGGQVVQSLDGTPYTMNMSQSEPEGYTACKQGKDNAIHCITSRNHFVFNLAWLEAPSPDVEL